MCQWWCCPSGGRRIAAETQREQEKQFVALRQQHSAVESEINCLVRGLNRCLDVGLQGYRHYVDYGVMSDNRHQIGRELLARATGLHRPSCFQNREFPARN